MSTAASSSSNDKFSKVPPRTADLTETWAFLSPGVDHIMTNLEAGLTFPNYTNLYTAVYNYCTSTKMTGMGSKPDGNRGLSQKTSSAAALTTGPQQAPISSDLIYTTSSPSTSPCIS